MTDKLISMRRVPTRFAIAALAVSFSASIGMQRIEAQPSAPSTAVLPVPPYARIADLVTTVPAIAIVRVKGLTPVPAERSPGLAPGNRRFLVAVETLSLIRSNDVLARQASFLLDLPGAGPHAKTPKWKGRQLMLFGKVDQRVDFFQLQSSTAALPWSAQTEAKVRAVAADLAATTAPPAIRGISSAFHVAGAIQGESETQIFLDTTNGSSVSLSIVRRPGEDPQFGAALGEVVDEAAALPAPDTPLWYRLSCGLPATLPAKALDGQAPDDAAAAARDYEAFRKAMRACDRTATLLS